MGKISKIERKKYRGWVYGIDVEKDESFVANGLVVHNCLLPETKIWIDGGKLKRIKDIQVGDLVLTHNVQLRKVVKTFSREINEKIIKITNAHGKILKITGDHPVLTVGLFPGIKWVKAKDLKLNQTLKIINDRKDVSYSTIEAIKKERYSGTVYNLEVEEDDSYITEAGVVHNCNEGVNQGAHFDILKSVDSKKNRSTDSTIHSGRGIGTLPLDPMENEKLLKKSNVGHGVKKPFPNDVVNPFQKEGALSDFYPEIARKIDGDIFTKKQEEVNVLETYQEAGYRPSSEEGKDGQALNRLKKWIQENQL